MDNILIVALTFYLVTDFCGCLRSMLEAKSRKEYAWHFADMLIAALMIFGFISLVGVN